MPVTSQPPIKNSSRVFSLLVGTAYLCALTKAFGYVTGQSLLVTGFWIGLGAFGVMASIALACMKVVTHRGGHRLRLFTLFLLFIPCAIYLTAIRVFVNGWHSTSPAAADDWGFLTIVLTIGIVVTTAVLLPFAEALMALSLSIARHFGIIRSRNSDKAGNVARLDLLDSVTVRRGHFIYESGHHGDLWLDLELLCSRPSRVDLWAYGLAKCLARHNIQVVCGPLVEGAFVALKVAELLDVEFAYAGRIEHPENSGLFPVEYRIPDVLRERLCGKRVTIVNDVINAGSAVRGTATDLQDCGAQLVAIACLATIGNSASQIAIEYDVPLFRLTSLEARIWQPTDCPLCDGKVPIANRSPPRASGT